jgi:hypothetical protein
MPPWSLFTLLRIGEHGGDVDEVLDDLSQKPDSPRGQTRHNRVLAHIARLGAAGDRSHAITTRMN